MVVMGGIVGSGIFINPYVVAQQVSSAILILAAWAFGGLIALFILILGRKRREIIDAVCYYWHFMGVLWIALFAILLFY